MGMVVASLFYSTPAAAQVAPTTKKAESVKITQRPEIERADSYLTIIRWTTNNPGGSPEHYGVVHYGTSPNDLSQTAQSPIRLNPDHPDTVFRVRINGLKPKTTYYYKVDSMEANGTSDGVKSPVKKFTTP
jgi:phosphodiesterase/alkaline phosphatase D-like protein